MLNTDIDVLINYGVLQFIGTDWLVEGPLMEVLVELGWCWGIVGDTSAASLETKVEAEEEEGPSGLSLEDDPLLETSVRPQRKKNPEPGIQAGSPLPG